MYRIDLYKEAQILESHKKNSEVDAFAMIDAMITAIHAGRHGRGAFCVSADQVNDIGMFERNLFDSKTFPYPMKSQPA